MKNVVMIFAMLALTACTGRQAATVDSSASDAEIPFEVAKNYFFKNDQAIYGAQNEAYVGGG